MNKGAIEPGILFPVIIQTADGTTTFYTSHEPLVKITKRAFDRKLLEGAMIVDSNGAKFKVARVINLGYINLLWGLNFFLDSEVYIRLELTKIEELSLEKFRSYARGIAKNNEDYYLSGGTSLKTILLAIDNAADVSTLTHILTAK